MRLHNDKRSLYLLIITIYKGLVLDLKKSKVGPFMHFTPESDYDYLVCLKDVTTYYEIRAPSVVIIFNLVCLYTSCEKEKHRLCI